LDGGGEPILIQEPGDTLVLRPETEVLWICFHTWGEGWTRREDTHFGVCVTKDPQPQVKVGEQRREGMRSPPHTLGSQFPIQTPQLSDRWSIGRTELHPCVP
jgi:hypothetical protein